MTHQPANDPKATIKALQEQFKDLCTAGMRGAEAIASFRENPKETLETVKECTAQIREGVSSLRTDLEAAKVPLLSGQEIYLWEHQALKDIAVNAGISIEEIEGKIKVQNGSVVELNLNYTEVKELAPLASLSSLQKLWLHDTRVSDLTPLANLSSLQVLWLSDTQVSDLTPLACLSSLQGLWLDDTQVSDLTPLAHLLSLQRLWLSYTQVSDLTPLANLSSLQKLGLQHTPALTASKHIIAALENRGVKVIKE